MTIEGFNQQQAAPASFGGENNSGAGPNTPVPESVANKFNWGAFLLNWIWGLGNRTYITLLIFVASFASIIPIIGALVPLAMCIWFGIKGNEWAWQNKRFESVEQFHDYQKKWAIAGLIVVIISIVLGIISSALLAAAMFSGGMNP